MADFLSMLAGIFTIHLVIGVIELPFSLLDLLLQGLLPLIIVFLFFKLLRLGLKKALKASKLKEEVSAKIYRWIRIIFRILYTILILLVIGRLFGAELSRYFKIFFSALNEPLIESGNTKITFVTLILLIPVFMIASWTGKLTRNLVNQSFLDRLGLDESKKFTLSTLLRYSAMVLVILIGLSIIGINLSSLAVLFGVLGIGVGFGLQGMVANFFAGLIILITRPIKEGDRILVNEYEGTVIHIRLLSTVINTLMEETIIVPNSKLVENTIHNNTYEDRRIYIGNAVQVSYASDLDKVMVVMEKVALANPYTFKKTPPAVRIKSFDESGVTMTLWTYIRDVQDKYAAISWNNLEIWRAFKREGIEIPFPQVDLHIKSGDSGKDRRNGIPEVSASRNDPVDENGTPV